MKSSTLVVLVVVTAVVGTVAALVSTRGRAKEQSEVASEVLFPDLAGKLNSVASVTLKKADKEFSFKRTETGWETADRGGFPAKVEKVKEALVALSQLRKLEQKTSKPENYAQIGVEDPGTVKPPAPKSPDEPAQTSNATLMTLKDDKGQTVTSVIIGNTKWDAKPSVYLRKAGEAQSWLADGRVDLPTDFTGWVDTQFASIPRERVKKAELTFPDGTKTLVTREKKEDQNFTVHNLPAGEELMGVNAGDAVGNAVSFLSFEDVRPAGEIDFAGAKGTEGGKPGPSSEFQTFDGMKVLIQTYEQKVPASEGKPEATKLWAHFVAAYDESLAPPPAATPPTPEVKPGETPPPTPPAADKKPEEVQKEVVDFNNKTAKWAFQLPDYKASGFKTTVASMLKSKPPAPPASLNEGNTAAPMNPTPLPMPPQNPPAAAPPATPPASAPPATSLPASNPPTPAPQPETKPGSPVKPPETPPQPPPAPTGGGQVPNRSARPTYPPPMSEPKVNVLLMGGGGREHALAIKLRESPRLGTLFTTHPDNPGLAGLARPVDVPVSAREAYRLVQFLDKHDVSLVVIGPEEPLAEGWADKLRTPARLVFGPGQEGAKLESDKAWSKQFMRAASIPTADARIFTDAAAATAYVKSRAHPPVVKAAGLAKGKGVFVPDTIGQAVEAIDKMMVAKIFGAAGSQVVVEERLEGPEVSVLALVDGRSIYVLETCQDHKRLGDDDTGPNTGGMGAFCPSRQVDDDMMRKIERQVLLPTLDALRREGIDYCGVLYAGLMLTPAGPKVLEFNCRFGDPECQALMARLDSDLLELILATCRGKLSEVEIRWRPGASCCIVLAAPGYPDSPKGGIRIDGLDAAGAVQGVTIHHAGTKRASDGSIVTAGGRVLGVTAAGSSIEEARTAAYSAADLISFEGKQMRRDIGIKA